MAKKLTDITNTYSKFAKDQILTETQLNEFLDYFDEQDRLSRVCLSGVGIACGFELSTDSNNNITITQGAGVTTDGDLIHLVAEREVNGKTVNALVDSITYTHFRPYKSEKVQYHPHFNSVNDATNFDLIPLTEIVSDDDKLDTDIELKEFDLRNKIALFYLECYPNNPDSCVTVNCENQGVEQVNRLRVLLVDREHVDRITRTDTLFNSYVTLESYLEAKTVYVPRVVLNDSNTASAEGLAAAYQQGYYLDKASQDLKDGVSVILNRLGRSRELSSFISNFNKVFSDTDNKLNYVLFQYKYDLLKDLADSYNELKELFLQNYATCCPNISAFPKHLLLGYPSVSDRRFILTPEVSFVEDTDLVAQRYRGGAPIVSTDEAFRHKFHKAPILLDSEEGNGRFDSVLARILTMVGPNGFMDRKEFVTEPIKITPSNVRVPLGKRAVPFYYEFNNNLMENWDFEKRAFNRYRSILGYRQSIYYSGVPNVANPFGFSIDPYNFYRIEGHQGLPYDAAFKEITRLKNVHSLPFDIKVLGIDVEEFDALLAEKYKCDFKDLGVLLKAWSSEQECIASEVNLVLSSFRLDEPGKNAVEDDFYTIKGPGSSPFVKDLTSELNLNVDSNEGVKNDDFIADFRRTSVESDFAFADYSSAGDSKNPSTNPVLSYINNEPNTVGYYLDQNITNANGNYANALAYTINTIDPIISEWEAPVAVSTVKLPLQIIVACTSLIELVPSSINQLTESTLDSYNVEIEKLCSYTKQLQERYRDPQLVSSVSDKTRAMVSLLVNQLTTICCSSKKLKALLEEVERRKKSIIERLNFASFAENNPGLEHKAGAGPGETFVLVYINKSIRRRKLTNGLGVNTGFAGLTGLTGFPGLTTIGTLAGSGPSGFGELSTGNTRTGGTRPTAPTKTSRSSTNDDNFALNAGRIRADLGNVTTGFEIADNAIFDSDVFTLPNGFEILVEKGTIIADFTLPYLCCSDCAPINFVVPSIPVSLTLSSDTYCIGGSESEIDLTVSPTDGTVTVVDSVPGVNISDKKLTIDRSIFPDELLGTAIKFKVDGEDTDAQLTVGKKPDVDFIYTKSGRSAQFETLIGSKTNRTKFDLSDPYTYHWDFGDGKTSTERNPLHDYSDSESQLDYIVKLTVYGTGGACPTIVTHPVVFERIEVEPLGDLSVCEGSEPIPFVIRPEGAFADIQGEGLNLEKTHFDPTLAGVGTFSLTYEGISLGTITVNPKPSILSKITAKVVDTKYVFSVFAENENSYQWTFTFPDGKEKTSVKVEPSYPVEEINKYAGQEVRIKVVVSNDCGKASKVLKWKVPQIDEPTARLEEEVFCKGDKGVYTFIIDNFTADTRIKGPGVDNTVSPPTFSPATLDVGAHNFKIDGTIVDSILIVEKPIISIKSVDDTSQGFVAVANIPSEVDVSSLVWNFLHPESNEILHEPVTGVINPSINFKNFANDDWTKLKITLEAQTEPCGTLSTSTEYEKPADVIVELEKYNFCEGDTGVYHFTFKPDDGSVTVTGLGVNTLASTFSPGILAPNTYTLNASNGNKINVTVHARSTIARPVVTEVDNGIEATASLPAGTDLSTVVWTFVDPVSNEELHNSISGTDNPSLSYSDFANESWTRVNVIVTFDHAPCLGLTSSRVFEKPEEVIVSLETLEYCKGDDREIFFTYQPNVPFRMTGPGLNSTGTGFFPNLLPVGPSTFTTESGDQPITVEVTEPVFGTMNEAEHLVDSNTLKLSYTESGPVASSGNWKIGTKQLGPLAESDENPWNINLDTLDLTPGTTLEYTLTLTSELCGEQSHSGSFVIPENASNCEDDMVNGFGALDSEKPTENQLNTFLKDDNKVSEVMSVYSLLSDLKNKPADVIAGNENDRIVTELHIFIEFLAAEMKQALEADNSTLLNMLAKLYRMAVEMYAMAFCCQTKVNFDTFTAGSAFNAKLKRHFNNKVLDSLIQTGIIVFDATNKVRVEGILAQKDLIDEPWLTIDFVINAKRVDR